MDMRHERRTSAIAPMAKLTASSTMDDFSKKRIADQESQLERSNVALDETVDDGSSAALQNFEEDDMKRRRVDGEGVEVGSSFTSTSDKEEYQFSVPFATTERNTTILNLATMPMKGKPCKMISYCI